MILLGKTYFFLFWLLLFSLAILFLTLIILLILLDFTNLALMELSEKCTNGKLMHTESFFSFELWWLTNQSEDPKFTI